MTTIPRSLVTFRRALGSRVGEESNEVRTRLRAKGLVPGAASDSGSVSLSRIHSPRCPTLSVCLREPNAFSPADNKSIIVTIIVIVSIISVIVSSLGSCSRYHPPLKLEWRFSLFRSL